MGGKVGSVSSAALRPGGRMTCRCVVTASPTGRFGCEEEGKRPNHAFHRTLRLRQRDPATGYQFRGRHATASAPRDNPCRKSAGEFTLVFDLCKSDGRYVFMCDHPPGSGARGTGPGRSILDPSRIYTCLFLSVSLLV